MTLRAYSTMKYKRVRYLSVRFPFVRVKRSTEASNKCTRVYVIDPKSRRLLLVSRRKYIQSVMVHMCHHYVSHGAKL
jgi:hypothetical protein